MLRLITEKREKTLQVCRLISSVRLIQDLTTATRAKITRKMACQAVSFLMPVHSLIATQTTKIPEVRILHRRKRRTIK